MDAWEKSPFYTDRERAALRWTETVTLITHGHVADEVYEEVRQHFSEKELSDLTLAVATIQCLESIEHCGTDGAGRLPTSSQAASSKEERVVARSR